MSRGAYVTAPWGLAVIAAASVACYRPAMVECMLACQSDDGCPDGMRCAGGLCTRGTACASAVAAGEAHTCATVGGSLACWGANTSGQLGTDDLIDRAGGWETANAVGRAPLPTNDVVAPSTPERQTVALGSGHTCVVLGDGRLHCWGDNRSGQLGLGDGRPRLSAREATSTGTGVRLDGMVQAVAAGLQHTCALLDGGRVKCWGDNRFGQLGLGAPGNRGGSGDAMGTDLPPVDLGARAVRSISAGAYDTCALLEGGSVVCWGWNRFGQLGVGDTRDRGLAPADLGAAAALARLPPGRSASAVAAGAFHTCVLLADSGAPACWGLNFAGQLGTGDSAVRGLDASRVGTQLPVLEFGRAGPAQAITVGADHTCILLRNLGVRCWGYNRHGELGIGDNESRGDDPMERVDRVPTVPLGYDARAITSLAAGAQHTCAVVAGTVKCWGRNGRGRLGTGDQTNRGDTNEPIVSVRLPSLASQ